MESNSVCNHTRDKQIGLPLRGRPILLSFLWLQPELDSTQSYYLYKSGEKTYLEVLSRFGLCRDFLNNCVQATISAFRSVKNMSVNTKSVEFQQFYAKP